MLTRLQGGRDRRAHISPRLGSQLFRRGCVAASGAGQPGVSPPTWNHPSLDAERIATRLRGVFNFLYVCSVQTARFALQDETRKLFKLGFHGRKEAAIDPAAVAGRTSGFRLAGQSETELSGPRILFLLLTPHDQQPPTLWSATDSNMDGASTMRLPHL